MNTAIIHRKVIVKMELDNIKINDLISQIMDGEKKDWDFGDVITFHSYLNRNLCLDDITMELGQTVNNLIRFWNQQDEENNIPVEERDPINLYIDSPGGNLTATLTIVDSIIMSKTPVRTINMGAAYSGGFLIFIVGHERISYPSASFMFHEGSTSSMGDAHKFRNFSDFYDKQLARIKEITLKYTSMTDEYYEENKKDDVWFLADEALEHGVCDKIAEEIKN